MTLEMLTRELREMRKEVTALKEVLLHSHEEWVTEKQAAIILGMSKDNLRKLRANGKIKAWRSRPSGRGIQYLKRGLESQFLYTTK